MFLHLDCGFWGSIPTTENWAIFCQINSRSVLIKPMSTLYWLAPSRSTIHYKYCTVLIVNCTLLVSRATQSTGFLRCPVLRQHHAPNQNGRMQKANWGRCFPELQVCSTSSWHPSWRVHTNCSSTRGEQVAVWGGQYWGTMYVPWQQPTVGEEVEFLPLFT